MSSGPRLFLASFALLAALGAGAASAPQPAASAPRRAVPARRCALLVTIDTLRWDYVGASGRRRARTPALDRLAREGYYVERAHSPAPLTAPAHASILTGTDPDRHGIRDNLHFRLSPGVPTLAERFREAGFRTAAVVSAEPLRAATGLARGFDEYHDEGLRPAEADSAEPAERGAEETTRIALGLFAAREGSGDLFVWVHYYDPHYPYRPPRRRAAQTDDYAAEVEYVDHDLARLVDGARAACGRETLRIAVASDHGEGLGEHGEATHGAGLYETTLAVPLILWPRRPGLTLQPGPHALIDLAPSLLEIADLPPAPADGESVFRLRGGPVRWLYAEALAPSYAYGVSPAYALRRGPWIALLHGAREAYETWQDPAQSRDQSGGAGRNFILEAAARLRERLRARPPAPAAAPQPGDAERLARLRSLGYLGGAAAVPPDAWARDDRRTFIARLPLLADARGAFARGDWAVAREKYGAFLAFYPRAAQIHLELGLTRFRAGDAAGAAESLALADELDPLDPLPPLNLGNLAFSRGDAAAARAHYERALARDPEQPEALLNLGRLLWAAGDRKAATPYLERFLVRLPDDREAPEIRALLAGNRENR